MNKLRPGEIRCLAYAANGFTAQSTAAALGCSRYNIEKQITASLAKLEVRTKTRAVVIAIELEFIKRDATGKWIPNGGVIGKWKAT